LKSKKSTRIAVTPCTTTPPTFAGLKARDFPRATPAMIPKIQPAENSHTAIVAIHHPISIPSFQCDDVILFCNWASCLLFLKMLANSNEKSLWRLSRAHGKQD
jgi:hypothetical protein